MARTPRSKAKVFHSWKFLHCCIWNTYSKYHWSFHNFLAYPSPQAISACHWWTSPWTQAEPHRWFPKNSHKVVPVCPPRKIPFWRGQTLSQSWYSYRWSNNKLSMTGFTLPDQIEFPVAVGKPRDLTARSDEANLSFVGKSSSVYTVVCACAAVDPQRHLRLQLCWIDWKIPVIS
jgi:hypothetical protein